MEDFYTADSVLASVHLWKTHLPVHQIISCQDKISTANIVQQQQASDGPTRTWPSIRDNFIHYMRLCTRRASILIYPLSVSTWKGGRACMGDGQQEFLIFWAPPDPQYTNLRLTGTN